MGTRVAILHHVSEVDRRDAERVEPVGVDGGAAFLARAPACIPLTGGNASRDTRGVISTFDTERLTLRPFTPGDGPALHGYLSQPQAVEFEPYDAFTLEDAMAAASARAEDPAFVAVCRRQDGRMIGNLYAAPHAHPDWATWEIGYVFDPQIWGQGYASEACGALLDVLFRERGAHRVVAMCNPVNTRSWALLERLGMRREAHMIDAASFVTAEDGTPVWHDTFQYAVLAEERVSSRR